MAKIRSVGVTAELSADAGYDLTRFQLTLDLTVSPEQKFAAFDLRLGFVYLSLYAGLIRVRS